MIAALLGWTKLPQWAIELLALALVAGGVWFWHYETYESGVKAEVAKVEAINAKTTQVLTTKAATAEKAHEDEIQSLNVYRDTHPEQPVSLCIAAPSVQAVAAHQVSRTAAPAATELQPVPGRDSGVRPAGNPVDIGPMLRALAASADSVTAQAREIQARDAP